MFALHVNKLLASWEDKMGFQGVRNNEEDMYLNEGRPRLIMNPYSSTFSF
jgi:hypothetical protein